MERFTLLEGDHTLKDSRQFINDALLTVRSLSASDAFPTDNLSDGMLCYRTDLGKLYQLADAAQHIWTDKITADISGQAATALAAPWQGITDKPAVYPPADHSHPYAGAASPGGAAQSADKLSTARTINGTAFDGTANITIVNSVAQGGTGATSAANARKNLGLDTAVTAASISGKNITLTKADGTTQTLTTQDTNTNNISAAKTAAKGYLKFNNGITLQWGTITRDSTNTFPLAFTTIYNLLTALGDGEKNNYCTQPSAITTTGFTEGVSRGTYYLAIGKI